MASSMLHFPLLLVDCKIQHESTAVGLCEPASHVTATPCCCGVDGDAASCGNQLHGPTPAAGAGRLAAGSWQGQPAALWLSADLSAGTEGGMDCLGRLLSNLQAEHSTARVFSWGHSCRKNHNCSALQHRW